MTYESSCVSAYFFIFYFYFFFFFFGGGSNDSRHSAKVTPKKCWCCCCFSWKKRRKEIFAYGLEFMLTLAKMQNNSTLMWTKIEIWGWSILKVIQAFHTVCIVLCIGRSGPVVGPLTATYWFYLDTRLLGQNTRYTELCVQYRGHYEEHFCQISLSLNQCQEDMSIKDISVVFFGRRSGTIRAICSYGSK